MVDAVQIEVDVDPLSDMEPVGDGHRRVKHRTCGSWLKFSRHRMTGAHFLECVRCGPLGEVPSSMIDSVDFSAIRGDEITGTIEVLPGQR